MSDIAVDVKDVSKRFRLAHGRYNSIKERVIHGKFCHRLRSGNSGRPGDR